MTMDDLTLHERAHERNKREAIRKRAARLGFRLVTWPNIDGRVRGDRYALTDATQCLGFQTLEEAADELRARHEPRRRRAA